MSSRQQAIPQNKYNTPKTKDWDQLAELRESARGLLMQADQIRPFLEDKDLQQYLDQPADTARLVGSVARDTKQYSEKFKQIADAHQGRQGNSQNEEEQMQALDLSLQYYDLTQSFEHVVIPNILEVCQHYLKAGQNREASSTEKTQ